MRTCGSKSRTVKRLDVTRLRCGWGLLASRLIGTCAFFTTRGYPLLCFFFFLNDPPPTEISTLPHHAALPIPAQAYRPHRDDPDDHRECPRTGPPLHKTPPLTRRVHHRVRDCRARDQPADVGAPVDVRDGEDRKSVV